MTWTLESLPLVLLPVELSLNLRLSFKVGQNKHAESFEDSPSGHLLQILGHSSFPGLNSRGERIQLSPVGTGSCPSGDQANLAWLDSHRGASIRSDWGHSLTGLCRGMVSEDSRGNLLWKLRVAVWKFSPLSPLQLATYDQDDS